MTDIPFIVAIGTVFIFAVVGIASTYAWYHSHRKRSAEMTDKKKEPKPTNPPELIRVASKDEELKDIPKTPSSTENESKVQELPTSSSERPIETPNITTSETQPHLTSTADSSESESESDSSVSDNKCDSPQTSGRSTSAIATKPLPKETLDKRKKMSLNALVDRAKSLKKLYQKGDIIYEIYVVLGTLGEGKFGRVVAAANSKTKEKVAIKIVTDPDDLESAKSEVVILQKLIDLDPNDNHRLVRMLGYFTYQNHFFIVFELLGLSVYDYQKKRDYKPYTLAEIRHIGYQICHAISFLHSNKIVHTDLKPENVVFVDRSESNIKSTHIKIIDFGTAVFEHEGFKGVVTTRHYRAPEVVLQLKWAYPADVWSIGCLLHEMYTGHLLFPKTTRNPIHLGMMVVVLGPIPRALHSNPGKTPNFVNGKVNLNEKEWNDVKRRCSPLTKPYKTEFEDQQLLSLVQKMLIYKSRERITAGDALQHQFFESLPSSLRL